MWRRGRVEVVAERGRWGDGGSGPLVQTLRGEPTTTERRPGLRGVERRPQETPGTGYLNPYSVS